MRGVGDSSRLKLGDMDDVRAWPEAARVPPVPLKEGMSAAVAGLGCHVKLLSSESSSSLSSVRSLQRSGEALRRGKGGGHVASFVASGTWGVAKEVSSAGEVGLCTGALGDVSPVVCVITGAVDCTVAGDVDLKNTAGGSDALREVDACKSSISGSCWPAGRFELSSGTERLVTEANLSLKELAARSGVPETVACRDRVICQS